MTVRIKQEITEWQDSTPNHIYHIGSCGRLVAYQPWAQDQIVWFSKPKHFSTKGRKFKTIKA